MALDTKQIAARLKNQPKKGVISRALAHQNRVRFHAQTALTAQYTPSARDFFAFVSNILPADKFKIFKTLFRYPIKTNEVTAICFDKLSRIFDGRNPSFDYQFMNTELRDDWEWYRQEVLHEPEVWATVGWDFFKAEINSVLIVDLPTEQSADDKYPAPYFYWLTLDRVLDYDIDPKTGGMRHIIFTQGDKQLAVIDELSYRLYDYAKGGALGALIMERPHDLGYCPARFFWDEPISLREPDIKASPLTKELESLDWFLFYHISKRHLDLFGAYPIISGYAPNCDYENENGDFCDGGYLRNKAHAYLHDSAGLPMRCPKCGNKRIAGAGSFVEVPIPVDGQPDLRNPVQMLKVDRESLDYNVAEEERLRADIITAVVGTDEDTTTREAINELQVSANFESQSTVITRLKKGFESAQQFVDMTVCRLRYGGDFLSARVNYGTEFFIYDLNSLRARYAAAKESGASEAELDALHTQILETEYRANPTQMQRMIILGDLEPYRHLSRAEVIELHDKGLISDAEVHMKLNFTDYVRRFERENANILEFGTEVPYDKKINTIKTTFQNYASENGKRS